MSANEIFQTSPLSTHLKDLRSALIRAFLAISIGSLVGMCFAKPLYQFLSAPLLQALTPSSHLIALHPIEAWMTYFKTGVLTGFFIATPYLFLLTWKFVAPGLYLREKKVILWTSLSFGILFVLGALFGYTVVFPIGFKAIVSIFGDTPIQLLPSMESTFSFTVAMLIAFGLSFELPLVVMGLSALGIVPYEKWKRWRGYSIVGALIVGGILTPPDPFTQILMAIPLILLFELGIWGAWFFRSIPLKTPLKETLAQSPSKP